MATERSAVTRSSRVGGLGIWPRTGSDAAVNARTIYERAVSSNITLSQDASALQLESGEVFQDDGPASGFSYKLNTEVLFPGVKIRKQLLIPDPRRAKRI